MARVLSCRFLRLECGEEEHPLFRHEYARSNRERGVKVRTDGLSTAAQAAVITLLRCFPHCCPEHVKRSYCGCSVHVLVTFSADVSAAALEEIVVCARFEPSRVAPLWPAGLAELARHVGAAENDDDESKREKERGLSIGETIALPPSLFAATDADESTDTSTSGWIRARREGSERHRAFPKNTALYVLNQGRSPKWMYSYDSSVTRTQREMTHHLVAYVFLVEGGEQQALKRQTDSSSDCCASLVVARLASPAFLLVSYRRSRGHPGAIDFPAGESAGIALSSVSGVQQQLILQQKPSRQLRHPGPCETKFTAGDASAHDDEDTGVEARGGDLEAYENSSMWQVEADLHDPGFLDKARHLLILWQFLQCVTLDDAGFRADIPERCVRSHWLEVAAALGASSSGYGLQLEEIMDSFLRNSFETSPSCTWVEGMSGDALHHEREALQAAACLLLRAVSSDHLAQLFRSACQVSMASSGQLHGCFASLVVELYNYACSVIQDRSADTGGPSDEALLALLDDILSLVYGHKRFGALRQRMSGLLMGVGTPASLTSTLNRVFHDFTAHVQRSKTATTIHPRSIPTCHNSPGNAWSRRWLIDPGSVQAVDFQTGNQDAHSGLRLVDVAQFVCEFGGVDLATGAGMSSVTLTSAAPTSGNTSAIPIEIFVDGDWHVYRGPANAILSLLATAGRWPVGHYAASFSDSGRMLHLDYFYVDDGWLQNSDGCGVMHTSAGSNVMSNLSQESKGFVDRETTVRRIALTLSLHVERDTRSDTISCCKDCRGLCVVVHAVTSAAIFQVSTPSAEWQGSGCLFDMWSTDRAALYDSLEWTELMELQARYIAVSCSRPS